MIHLLDPEVIAIGGGVCLAGDFLFEPLRKNVAKKCFYDDHGAIVPAQLGNDAGMIGAAMLGMKL
jgi:glucokinase